MLKELVKKCRTYRRFYQEVPISMEELTDLVDTARLTASASNLQPLRYKLVNEPELCAQIFPHLRWAGALKDWDGPEEGERPSAYIVIAGDPAVSKNRLYDVGITAQTIMLAAVEKGYGGCMMLSFERTALCRILNLDLEHAFPELVLALGKPKEQAEIVPVGEDGSTTYYRDENQVHYVPKRQLKDVLL